ncbi:hypothetical protein P3X46_023118 [Hevea brasiliensis]|uniref:WIT1/2 N-terminal helical bundle domain-containing protein n=1 Tax=Hevea brasiliensis TaxID=3981 RepID=A0ABQ9LA23_HEVBR|nr:WPP domain-interacting tail-anchored protein 2 [Hevea brasiliensis]XP_057988330.1 WPP domain-interacting tail-anchored protein 2 [Hevea brasiliensis]XP_057988331.1 WPP domain-interacting tail-anchored protein 2 [Hevea brasiliensis]XP_057988332.1 WPP domain-interacting tail-anchored protein 2 [Hevea brasiliensis]XP_057988333.1 WPP domain-interacting tail-anchored protein 2 [Hevea brasiliensis]XP_057988334.1 WPP domain-interacting tail-anchored protein 2 [Hevea brasiliensis]KAJ9163451.1 hypo
MEILTKADLDLAYSSEKLVHLHVLLVHLLAWDTDLEVMAMENSYISSVEKALVFDLLSGFLDSELREMENFMDSIQADIVHARHKIFSCGHLTELVPIMEEKLHDSEESLNKSKERLAEVKMQSIKLQRAFPTFRPEDWKENESLEFSANSQLPNIDANSKWRTAEQKKHILRTLEKSLARELYLDKKLSGLRQNEEQLKLKLHYTEQVTFRMEEAAEVVWGRFLEAENAAEVLLGISKELVGQLQIVQFNLNGSLQREAELKSELQDCRRQLDAKGTALRELESSISEHVTKSSEVPTLMEKLNSLEEQLKRSELCLKHANEFNEDIQEQLSEMENIVDSLKESVYEAETRAETAEAKVTQLTDTNLELTEEINFLKSSGDNNNKKVSLLEKQVRELESQLQHSKISSEVSQEQQNMLYSAIWDMETLIEDLKSKVSNAESKTESTEEQCIILSETNMELGREISFLRSRVKGLEASLDQANNSKAASAKEINLRTRLIMDTVRQLTRAREHIQNQLFSLTRENKILAEKLRNAKSDAPIIVCKDGADDKKVLFSKSNLSNETFGKSF